MNLGKSIYPSSGKEKLDVLYSSIYDTTKRYVEYNIWYKVEILVWDSSLDSFNSVDIIKYKYGNR